MTLKLRSTTSEPTILNIPPLNYSYYLNEGYKSHQAHYLDNARQYYDAAITIRPYRSQAYYNRALLMLQQKETQAAFSDIHAAISAQYLKLGMQDAGMKKYLQLSVCYSCDNYLAQSILNLLSNMKTTETQWKYKIKEQGKVGITREQGPIYPNHDFRLTGSCSNQIKCLDLQRLFLIYREICSQDIEHQDNNDKKEVLVEDKRQKIEQTVDLVIYPTTKDDISPFLQLPGKTEERFSINIQEFNPIPSYSYQNSINDQSFEIMTASHYTQNSFNNSFSSMHRFCHNGCVKCQKKHNNQSLYVLAGSGLDNEQKMLRIEIKTVEIYRFAVKNPRTYLIFNQSDDYGVFGVDREIATEVDYEGGYFPNWGSVCFYADFDYLKGQESQNKENQGNSTKKCKIELWHKETKSDSLIGSIRFRPKIGRYKWQLSRIEGYSGKKKHTGYLIMDIRK